MRALRRFVREKWQELLVMGVCLPVLLAVGSTGNITAIVATLAGEVAAIVAVFSLAERRSRPRVVHGEAFDASRNAVVFTVGRQKETILYSIAAQKPELVGFLCTKDTHDLADEIAHVSGFSEDQWHREICDPRDIVDIRDRTSLLFKWLVRKGLKASDIVLDPTGGLTTMSVGAFSAAEEWRIDTQYIRSEFDDKNHPIPGTQEAIYISRYDVIPPSVGKAQLASELNTSGAAPQLPGTPSPSRARSLSEVGGRHEGAKHPPKSRRK